MTNNYHPAVAVARDEMETTVAACEKRIATLQVEANKPSLGIESKRSLAWAIRAQQQLISIAIAEWRNTAERFGV